MIQNSSPRREHEIAVTSKQVITNFSLIDDHAKESLLDLIGTYNDNFPLKDGRLSIFIGFFTLDFFRKLKACISNRTFNQSDVCNIAKLLFDKQTSLAVVTIIACDICRIYQQQIKLIDGRTLGYYVKAFAQDCVDRILENIRKKQSRFKEPRRNIEFTSSTKLNDIQEQENITDDETLKQSTASLIEGFWTNKSKKKRIRRWISGKELLICPKYDRTAKEKSYKIISGNLLDRIYVKVDDDYYFPKKNRNPLRWLISRIPGRLINYPQDHVTKLCGYRLTSLIHTDKLHSKAEKVDGPNFQHLQYLNNNTLLNLHNFDDLKQFAELLVDYYNNSS